MMQVDVKTCWVRQMKTADLDQLVIKKGSVILFGKDSGVISTNSTINYLCYACIFVYVIIIFVHDNHFVDYSDHVSILKSSSFVIISNMLQYE